jgi:hypothetical protein
VVKRPPQNIWPKKFWKFCHHNVKNFIVRYDLTLIIRQNTFKVKHIFMNVFILNTGRCGSTTIVKACKHITNYTSAHESRSRFVGEERLAYPDNHIESDNRLSWYLGRLDAKYGKNAFYVHLQRNVLSTARSFVLRSNGGILRAYRNGIIQDILKTNVSDLDICLDYCHTVTANIETFLKNKPYQMKISLENLSKEFPIFWNKIEAEGNLNAAISELTKLHNSTSSLMELKKRRNPVKAAILKLCRIAVEFPDFIKYT